MCPSVGSLWTVRWEQLRWERLWGDLASQSEQLERDELSGEVADRAQREHATVGFGDRVRASLGCTLACQVRGGRTVRGVLVGAGPDWLALRADGPGSAPTHLVSLAAVVGVSGLARTAVPVGATGLVERRLDVRHVLRRVGEAGIEVGLARTSGPDLRGTVVRVGQDYVDLATEGGATWSVPLGAVACVLLT
jgi:hypothetical protein